MYLRSPSVTDSQGVGLGSRKDRIYLPAKNK